MTLAPTRPEKCEITSSAHLSLTKPAMLIGVCLFHPAIASPRPNSPPRSLPE